MQTALCTRLGIEFPIFAFSHCRDVVAAVSQAEGFGVLGALGFNADELKTELDWIDARVGDRPYGVDIVIPGRQAEASEGDSAQLEKKLRDMVPQGHRDFARQLLDEHGVPELPEGSHARELLGWTTTTAAPQLEVALSHERVRMIANALGTPPKDVIEQVQGCGRLIAALCGTPRHALAHQAAGVDVVIAQGSEAAAHTGEIGSVVLWPQVVKAVAPTPVLAAGGIGSGAQIAAALAMGAQGAWTGSLWLMVEESELQQAQRETYLAGGSGDTVRSRSFTGKPNRMCATPGPKPGSARIRPSPSACRFNTWRPRRQSHARRATPAERRTSPSTQSGR
jgi:NAD(P)H-dependent flavin oxidoreductase YrpB (nitropropane dioxygenase family)